MKTAFINGNIITSTNSKCEAFLIDGNKFKKVGLNEDILNEQYDSLIDLEGKTVLPGFNDSHLHFLGLGYNQTITNLSQCKTFDDIIKAFENNKKEFLVGRGWNQENIYNKQFPNKNLLDKISTDRPIIIIRVCGHVAVANSKAIELAGITKDSPQIDGGTFDFDSGLFTEDALGIIYNIIPKVSKDDVKEMFINSNNVLKALGVTTIQSDDFSTLSINYETVIEALDELYNEGKIDLRLVEQVNIPDRANLLDFINKGYVNKEYNSKFKMGPLKLLADGSLGGRTAYLREEYNDDSSTKGVPIFTQEELNSLVHLASKNNMDVAIHSIGDATTDMIIEAIDYTNNNHPRNHRHGIIHAQIIDHQTIDLLRDKKIGVYVQPVFLNSDNNIVYDRLGERANSSYLFKTMYDKGLTTAFGTDAPVEEVNPFKNLYCAITRKSVDGPNFNPYLEEEGFKILDAINCYTSHSAYYSYDEDKLGKIKERYLADFIIIDKDITTVSPDELLNTEVLETYIDGESVYKK